MKSIIYMSHVLTIKMVMYLVIEATIHAIYLVQASPICRNFSFLEFLLDKASYNIL
jgi:hypothetical protein